MVKESLLKLESFCERQDFTGWDPFDGLNSTFFNTIPFLNKSRFFRLAWIQGFKRSPVNLRKITGVKKDYNSKGLGLFLSGYCQLFQLSPNQKYLDRIHFFSNKLLELQNPYWSGSCWGYNFDWQARAFFQPKNTPTVVASVYVASSLLDAYEITGNEELLKTAGSTCDFILSDLNRTLDEKGNFCFSYSPEDKSIVYNASLLGSRLLSRMYHYSKESKLLQNAKKSIDFCVSHQNKDGSWGYGLLPYHQWIDNFHTGFNLECISDFIKYTGDVQYQPILEKGFEYYVNTFFTSNGIPKYYNNSTYPVDVHATAQLVITVIKLSKMKEHRPLIDKVLQWTINNMQSKKGYFYYQKNKYFTSKIPYMRWSQAWMFYAMATYLNASNIE